MRQPQEAISRAISIIETVISGIDILPGHRPSKATAKDGLIVVNMLPLLNDVLQRGVMNVNIHKDDIEGYPDNAWLNDKQTLITEAFDAYVPEHEEFIEFYLESQHTLPEVAMKETYVNLRYKVYLLN